MEKIVDKITKSEKTPKPKKRNKKASGFFSTNISDINT